MTLLVVPMTITGCGPIKNPECKSNEDCADTELCLGGRCINKAKPPKSDAGPKPDNNHPKPDTSINPDTNGSPDASTNPDVTVNPDLPGQPDIPTSPDIPARPDIPTRPDIPVKPDVPVKPDTPPVGCKASYMSPKSAVTGSRVKVKFKGTFNKSVKVLFQNVPLVTNFHSPNEISADLDLLKTSPGKYQLKVICAGNQHAGSFPFTILSKPNNAPVLSRVLPFSVVSTRVPLRVSFYGKNFVSGANIVAKPDFLKWQSVTVKSATRIDAVLANAKVGWMQIHVRNPDGQISNGLRFRVEAGNPTCSVTSTENHIQGSGEIDILMVMDNSCSMAPKQAALARSAKDMLSALQANKISYHIGVVTTDTSTRVQGGCLYGSTKYITNKTANAVTTLEKNLQPGTRGSAIEKGLEASELALSTKLLNDPKCNKGFLRPNANLEIIYFSDEPDQSPKKVLDYIASLKAVKAKSTGGVKASAIVGPPPRGCRSTIGSASQAPRYWQVSKTLGGTQQSICAHNAADIFKKMNASRKKAFALRYKPIVKTIVVKVNGNFARNWTYDAKSNAVVFSTAPAAGAKITIAYKRLGTTAHKESFALPNYKNIDILFVVDNSCSMSPKQAGLKNSAKSLIDALTKEKFDYHIGVTTTDTTGRTQPAGCLFGTTKIITNKATNPTTLLENNLTVGTRGSALERGLDAGAAALQPIACNKGYYRKDALFHILYFSDEEDQSIKKVSEYIKALQTLKGSASRNLVSASAIVGPPPSGCRNSPLSAMRGSRYWDVSSAVGGFRHSICSTPYSLVDLKRHSLTKALSYTLKKKPGAGVTIQVMANGKSIPGTRFDVKTNTVYLPTTTTLKPGTKVEVSFPIPCNPAP